jgi:hypothetical protein
MRCCQCNLEFRTRPGPHDTSCCPSCGSLYYEWLDVAEFTNGKRTAQGAAPVGNGMGR